MAEIDSLEVKISADAKTASASLDKLVRKLDVLSTSLNRVNVSKISTEFAKLSKSMSGFNGNAFKSFTDSAKTAEKSLNNVAKQASKGIKAKATFDTSDYRKATKELSSKFSNLKTDVKVSGNLPELQKQYQTLSASLDKLMEREQKIISVGATSPNSSVFKNLQYDIANTLNQMGTLGAKIKELSAKNNVGEIRIFRSDGMNKDLQYFKDTISKFPAEMQKITQNMSNSSILDVSIKNIEQDLSELKSLFPQEKSLIDSFVKETERLKGIRASVPSADASMPKLSNASSFGTEQINKANVAMEELRNKLNQLLTPKINETNLKKLQGELSKTESNLEELRTKLANGLTMGTITESADDKGYVRLQEQIKLAEIRQNELKNKINQTKGETKSFGETFREAFSSSTTDISSMKSKISSLASGMKKLGSATLSAIPGVKSLGKAINNSKQGVASLAKRFVSLYAIMRAGKAAWGSITSAQDYIEDFNYFSVALKKIGEDSKSQFKKAGYGSAEEYADSFKGRFGKLQKQMTGYDVDTDTGSLNFNVSKNLGLDISGVMQYQAQIAQVTNSTGQLGEVSINAAKGLSMLAADWSSLTNQNLADVQNNLTSALNGQARAVYKYGIDLTQAGLQQIAYNHGISDSVSKMSNMSKQQLRVLGLIESSKVAWGDLARTINQPANQLRMLQTGFKNLARSIGNVFMPIIEKVYPYLNAMVIVLQEFVQWIAKLTGADLSTDDVSGVNLPDYSDAADDVDDYADAADKASKKQKKFNDNLQGFDIINKLQKDDDSSDSSDESGKNKNIDLSGDIASAMANYQKAWDKAFENAENKAVQIAAKIKKALLSGWEKGDFTELGKKVASWINKALANIPWNKIKATVKKIARSIATFLNGFIKELDWTLVGKTLAEGLNTLIEGAYEFWSTFDWLEFGTSLAEGVNSFIENFDAEKFGKLLGTQLRSVIQTAFGFVTNFNFEELGNKIGEAINGFLEDMGAVDERTGLTGWQELGQTISTSITGILDTINTALGKVKWDEVGKAIGQFLTSIDWWGILGSLAETLGTILKSVVTTAVSAIAEDPAGMIKALTGAFALIFAVKNVASVFSGLKKGTTKEIADAIQMAIGGVKPSGFTGALSSVAKLIGTTFKGSMQVAMAKAMAGTGVSGAIFRGLNTAFSAVSGKVSALGATLKGVLTSEGFLASFAPVAVAVAGAVISGNLIADRLKEAIDAINFTGDYELKVPEGFKKGAEEARKAFENTAQNVENIKKEIGEINKDIETTDGNNIQDLANKYFELSQKTNPTASDIAVMKKYSEELSQTIPGLSENVDKETGAFKGSKEKLDGLIQSYERAAKAQAAYNSAVKLYEKQKENQSAIDKKKEELGLYEKEFERVHEITEEVGRLSGKDSERYKAQVKLEGTYSEKVKSTRAEIEKLEEAQKDIDGQIKKNNKTMENAKVSAEKYEKANKSLKDKMKELGVTSKSQKDVIKELNNLVDNGEISWKDYKKVVDGNYKSVGDLNSAIEKLSPKSVEIKATTSGETDVSNLGNEISAISDKNVTITANASVADAKYKINDLTTGRNITIKAILGNTEEFREKVKNALKTTDLKMNAAQLFPSAEQIAAYFKQVTNSDAWKNAMNFTPTYGKKVQVDDKNKTVKIPKDADLGGILSKPYAAMGYKISYYALGGFPDKGQLFIANEAGPELVGNMNGKTTVAPQTDIAEGFAQAITSTLAPVMYSAFKQAASETATQSGGDVYLDGTKLTDAVVGHINQVSKSRGRSPLWGVN